MADPLVADEGARGRFFRTASPEPPPLEEIPRKESLKAWQWLSFLTEKKVPLRVAKLEHDFSSYSPRAVTRALAGDNRTTEIAGSLVMLKSLMANADDHYNFLFALLPKVRLYAASIYGKEDDDTELVGRYCNLAECGSEDARSLLAKAGSDAMRIECERLEGGRGENPRKSRR